MLFPGPLSSSRLLEERDPGNDGCTRSEKNLPNSAISIDDLDTHIYLFYNFNTLKSKFVFLCRSTAALGSKCKLVYINL